MNPDRDYPAEEVPSEEPSVEEAIPREDQPGVDMPAIGKFVEQHVLAIAEHCDENPDEFQRLQEDGYSKGIFGLNYPFFRKPDHVVGKYAGRYRKSPQVVVCGETVLFTNDWYGKHYAALIAYLEGKQLIDNELAEAYLDSLPETGAKPLGTKAVVPGILKSVPIGDAQNLFVRNILGRVRPDEQSYGGWQSTWEYFDHRCAYCGTPLRTFDKDHVYGINYTELGEHKRGNLVPACKECNAAKSKAAKSGADFRAYLTAKHAADPAEAMARITKIEWFMAERDYVPVALDPRINEAELSALLKEARLQVEALAADYVEKIRRLLAE